MTEVVHPTLLLRIDINCLAAVDSRHQYILDEEDAGTTSDKQDTPLSNSISEVISSSQEVTNLAVQLLVPSCLIMMMKLKGVGSLKVEMLAPHHHNCHNAPTTVLPDNTPSQASFGSSLERKQADSPERKHIPSPVVVHRSSLASNPMKCLT